MRKAQAEEPTPDRAKSELQPTVDAGESKKKAEADEAEPPRRAKARSKWKDFGHAAAVVAWIILQPRRPKAPSSRRARLKKRRIRVPKQYHLWGRQCA
jgi:hypothetical protein